MINPQIIPSYNFYLVYYVNIIFKNFSENTEEIQDAKLHKVILLKSEQLSIMYGGQIQWFLGDPDSKFDRFN